MSSSSPATTTTTQDEPIKPFYYTPDKEPMILGEGCTYRSSDSTLHWVDCDHSPPRIFILKVDPETGAAIGEARILELPSDDYSVTVLSFRKNHPGSYICAYWQGVCTVDEETGEVEVLKEIFPYEDRKKWRFNDGAIDAKGRFWLVEIDKVIFGMGLGAAIPQGYGPPRGKLWRYDPDGSLHCMLDGGIICGNGIGWSPDNRTMYLMDSNTQTASAFDFDLESGNITNQRELFNLKGGRAVQDGMVVDTDGNIWIAVYMSSSVQVWSPEGKLLKRIPLSAMNPTCTTWGGKNWDLLFVTSGRDRYEAAQGHDDGGQMFLIKADGARGQEKYQFGG